MVSAYQLPSLSFLFSRGNCAAVRRQDNMALVASSGAADSALVLKARNDSSLAKLDDQPRRTSSLESPIMLLTGHKVLN